MGRTLANILRIKKTYTRKPTKKRKQPDLATGRLSRETLTVERMICRYCADKHQVKNLCPHCAELLQYAHKRLAHCPYQDKKTVCSKCPTHCGPRQKEEIKAVMRYAGPRLMWSHPILCLLHYLHGLRSKRQMK